MIYPKSQCANIDVIGLIEINTDLPIDLPANKKSLQVLNSQGLIKLLCSPYGNRTRVTRMKIWCPNP